MQKEEVKSERKKLGEIIKNRRLEMGIDENVLAEKIGVTANTVKGIESGRFSWDIDLYISLCNALNINYYNYM